MKRQTKLLSLVLALLMIVPMLSPFFSLETEAAVTANSASASSSNAWDGTIATAFANDGTTNAGSSSNPYQIATGAQLALLAKLINDPATCNTYKNKYYKLTANIDLNNIEWTPIGGVSYSTVEGIHLRFQGTFDGDGHTISNLKITEEQPVGAGLFGILSTAKIKNFTLTGKITAGAIYDTSNPIAGCGMVAIASYGANFTNVNVYANIDIRSNSNSNFSVGGFFGYGCNGTTFSDCEVYGTISTKLSDFAVKVGGFAGHMRYGTLARCLSDVDIYVRDSGNTVGTQVGGIIGYTYANSGETNNIVNVRGCRFTGNLYAHTTDSPVYMGGMIGRAGYGVSENDYTVGGYVNVNDCFYDGTMYVDSVYSDTAVLKGAMIGGVSAYVTTIKRCFSSSNDEIYNKISGYTYSASTLTINDENNHIKGIGVNSDYGAAIRLANDSTGLRFNSSINKTLYNTLNERTDLTVKLGTLIAPMSYVEEADGFTVEELKNYAAKKGYTTPYVDVTFDPNVNEWLDEYYNDSTSHFFSGAMSDIAEENYNRVFGGVGYVEIKSNGYTHRFYSSYYDSANARSAAYVAMRADSDRQATKSGIYKYLTADNDYSPYTSRQLERIQMFAAHYDASAMDLSDLKLMESGISKYAIVYPLGADGAEHALAVSLQQAIYKLTGVKLAVRENFATTDATPYEIVIGCAEHASAYEIDLSAMENEYAVFTAGKRVVLLGDSDAALSCAVNAFVNEVFHTDLATATNLTQKYFSSTITVPKLLRLNGENVTATPTANNLSSYTIVYTSGNTTSYRMAYSFQQRYLQEMNKTLPMATSASSKNKIVMTVDSSLTNGDFKITTSKSGSYTTITVKAGSYYGFEGAEDFIIAQVLYGLQPVAASGFTYTGNFADWVTGTEVSTQYAYNKMGTVRVMFNNVLFNNSTGTQLDSSGNTWNDVPTDKRNPLQQTMIEQYMPDVLGCQEFNASKRGNATAGNGGLAGQLAALGYVEAVDPRVKNAYATSTTIPGTDNGAVSGTVTLANLKDDAFNDAYADRISGTEINGYGTSGATKVTVGGSTYYTYYNNTPLFYNPNTTRLIKAEYYWYKYQWDQRTCSDCTLCKNGTHVYADMHHPNSASDCGSKSATWGVFESIETGERYIVITTHMATRSDYIRGLQAEEMVALINQLVAQYNCPVFLGGDMNGSINNSNYRTFVDIGKYTDVAKDEVAQIYSSELGTTHGYPIWNSSLNMMLPTNKVRYDSNSIDCIFATNDAAVRINVFGVVADDCTESASDHLPIFIDFIFPEEDEYSKRY